MSQGLKATIAETFIKDTEESGSTVGGRARIIAHSVKYLSHKGEDLRVSLRSMQKIKHRDVDL